MRSTKSGGAGEENGRGRDGSLNEIKLIHASAANTTCVQGTIKTTKGSEEHRRMDLYAESKGEYVIYHRVRTA